MRAVRLLFGVACYAVFFLTFLYLIAFVEDAPFVPRTVSNGPAAATGVALAIDLALIALFGVQHSVMARPRFKAWWTKIVPSPIERSVYVLITSVLLILMFWAWRPVMPGMSLWWTDRPVLAPALLVLGMLGWAVLLVSTYLINHFELFGLKQVWTGQGSDVAPVLRTPLFYRLVRHPLYTGFLIAFWVTPHMTVSRLLFAAGMTVYILIGIWHEERDLVATFGDDYVAYRAKVGSLIPGIGQG